MRLLPSTEYTEWQRPLSGVHSIMMEKLAQAVRLGGARPAPVTLTTIMYKVVVYRTLQLRGRNTPYFYSNLMFTLCTYLKKSPQVKKLTKNPVWFSLSLSLWL